MQNIKGKYSINFSSKTLNVSRRSFYRYLKTKKSKQTKQEVEMRIVDQIEEIVLQFPGYGYRRVTKQLDREGLRINGCKVNHKRVLRLMREKGLLCQLKKAWINTTNSNHSLKRYPNLVKELGITPNGLDQLWVADITYIRLPTEFIYLATILDSFSRKVIGFYLSRDLSATLAVKALNMAIVRRGLAKRQGKEKSIKLIHHSDQGVQYCSKEYVEKLKEHEIDISMTDKKSPWQNGQAESFFKTLKGEEVYLSDYQNFDQAKENITQFIKEVYNKKRLHSAIDYLPPEEYEELLKREKDSNIYTHKQEDLVVST